ncbi:MAG: TIM barrel protein [Phycisphaerales bacterium]|nr:TIM barrel protein [Phycisphaerales bacterium]
MRRREFIQMAACAGAAAGIGASARAADGESRKFALPYAPHFGMFREHAGDDPVAQLKFMASEGFTAFEDNGMAGRSVEEQQRIAKAMERLGLRMGVFVANFGTAFGKKSFSRRDPAMLESFLSDLRSSVEVAKRVNAKWMTIVLGDLDPRQEMGFQTANAIEMLRRGAEVFEPHDLVMVMEPLNPWRDHPGMFLSKIPQAYELCKAVDSPAVKILFDLYHQQVTEGNLIPNIDAAWDEIGYLQIGDNPGRNEPTTGEVNYRNIFAHLKRKGYTGILGMEHGNSKPGREGERAVIDAYRWCDEIA